MNQSKIWSSMIGQKFGRLLVLDTIRTGKESNWRPKCKCLCDCGKETIVLLHPVRYGQTVSCGCVRMEKLTAPKKHGQTNTRLHQTWRDMKQRCCNPKNCNYKHYGEQYQ